MSLSSHKIEQRASITGKSQYSASDLQQDLDDGVPPNYQVRRSASLFGQLMDLIPWIAAGRDRRGNANYLHLYHAAPTGDSFDSSIETSSSKQRQRSQPRKWLRLLGRILRYVLVLTLCLFGALHILLVLFGRKQLFWDLEEYQEYLPAWEKLETSPLNYLKDSSRYIAPVPCSSHNDYWRRTPLFDALYWGCTSVEADVSHFNDEDDLFVGHNTASLTRENTFANLYVNPLVDLLDSINADDKHSNGKGRNGVFKSHPEQTLVLLIDFKTDGHDLFPHVLKQLEPLRQKDYLSYWDGNSFVSRAITVVGTGNTPFDLITNQNHPRDIFFDAPLDELWEMPLTALGTHNVKRADSHGQGKTGIDGIRSPDDFNISNSYFASVSLGASIGSLWRGSFTEQQLELIRGQIQGAKRRGLKARYWGTPSWPTSLRNHVWQVLVNEGVDILNVDDLKSAVAMDWNAPIKHAWFDA